jgi:hypothetical protein
LHEQEAMLYQLHHLPLGLLATLTFITLWTYSGQQVAGYMIHSIFSKPNLAVGSGLGRSANDMYGIRTMQPVI